MGTETDDTIAGYLLERKKEQEWILATGTTNILQVGTLVHNKASNTENTLSEIGEH